ncbi:MAG: DUF1638 domain-containing protein [Deltaproteobacteria bacterium]|nr:DUF1638 domain-containing protein [Deltaproteobacteria bacterium]
MDCGRREESNGSKGPCVVVACRVMKPELEQVRAETGGPAEILYLDQALHRTPAKLLGRLQEKIDEAAERASQIVLGYGLCSNGVVGITARRQGLVMPRCHDCIALFLGSPARYDRVFRDQPGTYYLTPGWIAEKKDPLGIMEENEARFDRETALWVLEEEFRHYTRICLIDTGVGEMAPLRARARQNAEFLKKRYEEIPGSLDYFREIVQGPHGGDKFLRIGPGEAFRQEMFF